MEIYQCRICGTYRDSSFDYKTGRNVQPGESILCDVCFVAQVDALTARIYAATPSTVDSVYLRGMIECGAGADALSDVAQASEQGFVMVAEVAPDGTDPS